jgi:hypothetical protein
MPNPRPIDLLKDAIDAARVALRDLEADEVSARLQRVRGSSERTLPPPLAASLLKELSTDEFLRGKALEAWDGDRPPAGGPALASFLFLMREPGWETDFAAAAFAHGERHGAASDRSGELERESLAAEIASLKEQLRRSRKESEVVERELREALDAERAPGRADRTAEQRALDRLEASKADWEANEAALRSRIGDLESEIRRLKEDARPARLDRAEIAALVDSGATGGLPTEPAGLARLLDDLTAHAMAMAPSVGTDQRDVGSVDTGLPAFDGSLRPDQAEAIDWLVGVGFGTVLIDGYNLGFALAGLEAERARAVAIEAAGRLGSAAPGMAVTVVFDSALDRPESEASSGGRSGGATVVFTEGEIADDAIVDLACGAADVVVITNDRDLRQRSEACGAVTVWSDALVEWSRRR